MKKTQQKVRRRSSILAIGATIACNLAQINVAHASTDGLRGSPTTAMTLENNVHMDAELLFDRADDESLQQRILSDESSDAVDDIIRQTSNETEQNFNLTHYSQRIHTGPFMGPVINFPDESERIRPQSRIVGGQDAAPHSFYVMLLLYSASHGGWLWSGCGGTLISDCHVLTAGHCNDFGIPIGGVFVNAHRPMQGANFNAGQPYHFSHAEYVTVHPDYNRNTNFADIAVVKMKDCLDPNQFQPAALAVHQDKYYRTRWNSEQLMLKVMGFGATAEGRNDMTSILKEVTLPFIPRQDCQRFYGLDVQIDMICAGYTQGNIGDACHGDSGGGLIEYVQEEEPEEKEGKEESELSKQLSIYGSEGSVRYTVPPKPEVKRSPTPTVVGIVSWQVYHRRRHRLHFLVCALKQILI